ncbi:hypothetical protein [Microbacterium sp.]|uniref:hypothetical protein n=1 Tax=Microbacterium sp. TaxID=51671 RepID=UPI002811268A|nr:hypothetical protein [Microbacterium sp.]
MSPEVLWTAFGWFGSAVLVVSLSQTNILRLRVLNLTGCVLAIAYNTPLGVWPSVGLNVALAAINVFHLLRLRRRRGTSAMESEVPSTVPGSPDAPCRCRLAG